MRTAGTVQQLLRLWLKFSDADRFDKATWRPRETQEQKLLEIVRRNEATDYGRKHDFTRIRSIKDYQDRVPVNTYDSLSPYIERMLKGEERVLTADNPLMFATTSGTTGRSKYIPVTPSYLHEYGHGMHVHSYRCFTDFRDVLEGKLVVSSSSDEEGRTEGGVPYGAISGYLSRTMPAAIRRFYALPYEVSKLKQIDQKYYVTLRYALANDVRILATPNPSSLLLLAQKLNTFGEELVYDIRQGGVNPRYRPDSSLGRLMDRLPADTERARTLDRILRETGRLRPVEVWPNLRLLSCWKGGTMPLYLRKLPEHYGDTPVRDLGYMASEGRGATPLVNSGSGGVVTITTHFFEFVPEDRKDEPNPQFLTCDQLESDREYYVYLTTSGGLYRYDINDVLRVVDFYRNTPVIQFVRKGQGMSSITGEKLAESQVTDALLDAVSANGFNLEHITACPEWSDPPRYAFYAEMEELPDREQYRQFVMRLDQALCARNEEYEAKRASQRLGHPVLKRVAPGSYQALRQRRVAEGAPESQVKLPHLNPNMQFGEQFQVLDEITADAEAAPK